MSEYHNQQISDFCLEGRFMDFVIKDGYKLKGLQIWTAEGECYIKLAKHLRFAFDLHLPRGTWLQIVGKKKHKLASGEVTFKAERVMAARQDTANEKITQMGIPSPISHQPKPSSITQADAKPSKSKSTILVCQKSDCMKRGGKGVCQALEAALSDRGLEDQVTIKGTGCMKNCKAGPNVVMPDKTRYTRISAAQVSNIIDKHFGDRNPERQLEEVTEVPIPIQSIASGIATR
ncbi:(2Fe-2S) ferredoxin domain-containing protein [Calothrix sp. FACHB-1219]|uniref:(2Fe-2S) ferredoxin domain-containing protein n=1 Tax=unclassified Calothrix TaxID=2619626 RepID=UPI001686161B|nr:MULTISPECIES: (2Fe-2S) ferredoxin domain-containing protein [unclassified Calothrix]MBD2204245.1 (2Fe-2S) ferredoxin domain-containing protein [Calothrix sp. FACHB-168]MBD2220551.1 (2Fe-2S) ferredoxin domain-containing protein [Calothrix sp. FACHB-1219]